MAICDNAKDLGEGDVPPTESYLGRAASVFSEKTEASPSTSELNCERDMTCLHTARRKREPLDFGLVIMQLALAFKPRPVGLFRQCWGMQLDGVESTCFGPG